MSGFLRSEFYVPKLYTLGLPNIAGLYYESYRFRLKPFPGAKRQERQSIEKNTANLGRPGYVKHWGTAKSEEIQKSMAYKKDDGFCHQKPKDDAFSKGDRKTEQLWTSRY